MKITLSLLLSIFGLVCFGPVLAQAQVTVSYTGPAVPIPDNLPAGVNIFVPVSGVGIVNDLNFRFTTIGACDATIGNTNSSVSHTFVGDLTFRLTPPDGSPTVAFMIRRGGTRENICLTNLNDEGGFANVSTITSTTGSPVAGDYSPETSGALSQLDGENANGTWALNVSDSAAVDTGHLRRFALIFNKPNEGCVLTCPSNITVASAANQCSNTATYPAPIASSSCGTVTCSPPSGQDYPLGTTVVTCTDSPSQVSCSFNVAVNDAQAPAITCPGNIALDTSSDFGAAVEFASATASDNCPGLSGASCNHSSGEIFPLGSSTVTCSSTDGSGNQSSCSFNAVVNGNASIDSLPGDKPVCLGGAKIKNAKLVLSNLGGTVGDEVITLRGKAKFKGKLFSQINGQLNGAQIQVVDVGNNNATVFELSPRTDPILGGVLGTSSNCGAGDGWIRRNEYINFSNKLGAPTCIDKSANGLRLLKLGSRSAKTGLSNIQFSTTNSNLSLGSFARPLNATVIFGDNSLGAAKHCAVAKFKKSDCGFNKAGNKLTCAN